MNWETQEMYVEF